MFELFIIKTEVIRVALCSSGYPRIHYVDQAGPEFTELSAFLLKSSTGIKGICHCGGPTVMSKNAVDLA